MTAQKPAGSDKPVVDDKGNEVSPDQHRTLTNRPTDPNSLGADVNIPPGVKPEDAHDPGRQTPGAPPVVNRS